MKTDKSRHQDTSSATLWTPWGMERPVEREARNIAIKRLLRKVAEIRRRELLRAVAH